MHERSPVGAPRIGPHRTLLAAASILALTTLILWGTHAQGPYEFDDWVTPLNDPASSSIGAFARLALKTLRPLTKLTFALESSAGLGDSAAVRRAVTASMLGAGAALLFALLARMRVGLVTSAGLALLYALHPIQGDGVWLLANRSAVLASTLVLLACYWAVRRRWRAAAVALALACLARETAIAGVLPLAALSVARHETEGWRVRVARLEPVLTAALLMGAYLLVHPRYSKLAQFSLQARPWGESVARQVAAIPHGLSLWFALDKLSSDHGELLPRTMASPAFIGGATILVGLVALAVVSARARRTRAALGASLVLAALLPTQSAIPKLDALTEKPFAFALAGFVMLVAEASALSYERLTRVVESGARRWVRLAAQAATGLLAGTLGVATIHRCRILESPVAFWADAARKSTANARPHLNHALALEEAGELDAALEEVIRARTLDPFDPTVETLEIRLRVKLASASR
ncbi:MAG: hypothetical protein U0271_43415 [Polyangiaceae bacterium]